MRTYGICLGASTISAVELIHDNDRAHIGRVVLRPHDGNPRGEFQNVLDELDPGEHPLLVTGRKFRSFVALPSIPEPEAVEQALHYINNSNETPELFDAVVSAGGETFMVYLLDDKQQIVGISTGNKCASGTGEFFLQQIRRMDLDIDQAVLYAGEGNPYSVSGRCSVFCKSDCTHALNKGEPIADVTAGLCRMIAGKIYDLLATVPHQRVLLVGGTARNTVVVDILSRQIDRLVVPEQAAYFEALGAAQAALQRGQPRTVHLFNPEQASFSFLPPPREFESLVTFNQVGYGLAQSGDVCLIGLDVGSTTTKTVALRSSDDSILGSVYLRTNGNPVEASRACFRALQDQLGDKVTVNGIGVTGSGRKIAGLYALTEGVINEIIAHAAAAVYFDPEVDTIFEIGGQDAKYTHIQGGVASDYAMNEACSAGTGSFLEESALESLGIPVENIAELALQAERAPNFSDQCAAFISSDITTASHEGISREEILAGLVYSISFNYVNRVKGEPVLTHQYFK